MPLEPVFAPTDGDGCEPYRLIANRLECSEGLVLACARGLGVPEWINSPREGGGNVRLVRDTIGAYNDAVIASQNLYSALSRLSQNDRESLVNSGCVTLPQIKNLVDTLARDQEDLSDWLATLDVKGGKNPAAFEVAKLILRIFRVLGKRPGFGQSNGYPSTPYCSAVDFALSVFGIKSNWRSPARAALEEWHRRQAKGTRIPTAENKY